MGFDLGPELEGIGRVLLLADILGGLLIHEKAEVAVVVSSRSETSAVILAQRIGGRWQAMGAKPQSPHASFRNAVLAACNQYYSCIEAYSQQARAVPLAA
jgi:hypothetical protein